MFKYILFTNDFFEREVKNSNRKYKFETYTAMMLEDDNTGQLKPVMLPEHMGPAKFLEQRAKLKAAKNNKSPYRFNRKQYSKKFEKLKINDSVKIRQGSSIRSNN